MDISNRQRMILRQIIMLYTFSGDPVGSKLLSQLLDDLAVSSATLRNEMALMTSLGLLSQPHTSAGRIPSNEGYRYYVDHLIVEKPLTREERDYIKKTADEMDFDPERAAEEAAATLANVTGLAAITTTPTGGNIQITHYEIVRAGRYNLAVLGISSIGGVRSRICRVQKELDGRQLNAINAVLNDHLVFVSPEDITNVRLKLICAVLGEDTALFEPILSAAIAIIRGASEAKVFTEGQQHLLNYPELDSCMKQLMELFSNHMTLLERLDIKGPIRVFVGDEPGAFDIDNLGLVAGRYRAAGGRQGSLAVAGPVRMDYGFVIPRLVFLRDCMSAALTNPGI
jgi:heat-inducible transcriptional repressor